MITAELKAKWVAALRSGLYKQTTGTLKREVDGECEYCCLGVLCEVAGLESFRMAGEERYRYISRQDVAGIGVHCTSTVPYSLSTGRDSILMEMNDGQKSSFSVIADYIEKEVKVA